MTSAPAEEGSLLFIYAADGGLFNTAVDIAHKIFSPQTYPCRLCALTHGHFTVRNAWQDFVASLAVPCLFLHRDEAASIPGIDTGNLPSVYRWQEGHWQLCMSRDAITGCRNLEQLMTRISSSCTEPKPDQGPQAK